MADRAERPEVGIARLEASVEHLLRAVESLSEEERSNHDAINDLENRLNAAASGLRDVQAALAARAHDDATRVRHVADEADERAAREQRHLDSHRRVDEYMAAAASRTSAWKARAGWVVVTVAGMAAGLLGDWLKRLLGLGGP